MTVGVTAWDKSQGFGGANAVGVVHTSVARENVVAPGNPAVSALETLRHPFLPWQFAAIYNPPAVA